MDKIYTYAIAKFDTGLRFCRAPFGYSIKSGDLVDIESGSRKGKVLAVEIATENNSMLNLLTKVNYSGISERITAIYSRKEIEREKEND